MENESRKHPNISKVHLTKYISKVWKTEATFSSLHNSISIHQFKMGSDYKTTCSCLNFTEEQSEEKDHKAEEKLRGKYLK